MRLGLELNLAEVNMCLLSLLWTLEEGGVFTGTCSLAGRESSGDRGLYAHGQS